MDRDELQELPAQQLSDALDRVGIAEGWGIGDEIRGDAEVAPDSPCLPEPNASCRQGFQNQVVGRLAEKVFRDDHLAALEADGFQIVDYHEAGENRDYGVQKDGSELPINVKVASTRFRNALKVVGLHPNHPRPDKCLQGHRRRSVFPRLSMLTSLTSTYGNGSMGSWTGSAASSESDGISWLMKWRPRRSARRGSVHKRVVPGVRERLEAAAPGVTSFRVISAERVLAILRENPRRVPGSAFRALAPVGS